MIRPADLKDDDVWSMLRASRDGDLTQMKELASRRPELIRCTYNYTPPIHFAVREGHLEVVRYLLEQGADPAYRTYPFQDSLLTLAQDRGYYEIAELLLNALTNRVPVPEGLSEFLDAARKGDFAQIESGLSRNPQLAAAGNETGDTALHHAADGGHPQIVSALLDAGANPDAMRSNGVRPIHCALHPRGQQRLLAGVIAGMLLARGAAYDIYLAAVLGDAGYVREALLRDPNLANYEDSSHRRPISAAARRNDFDMVKLLLEHGANPSLPEEGAPLGQALWIAVYQKQLEMAKLLLQYGANPNTAPESSGSALFQARKDPEFTRLLLEYGAEDTSGDLDRFQTLVEDGKLADVERLLADDPGLVRQPNAFWGEGILCGPARQGNLEMLELLFRYGAKVPDITKWGRSYYFKHVETAAFLLARGMNPNHMNWHHITLLHDMAQEGDVHKVRLLLDYGADLNAVDEEYRSTALGFAARWGNREVIALLLERGADPNKSGASWSTPLAWARKKGYADIEADLRRAGAKES